MMLDRIFRRKKRKEDEKEKDLRPLAHVVRQEIDNHSGLYLKAEQRHIGIYRSSDDKEIGSFLYVGNSIFATVTDSQHDPVMPKAQG